MEFYKQLPSCDIKESSTKKDLQEAFEEVLHPEVEEPEDYQMNVLISQTHGQNTVEVKNQDFEKRIMGNRRVISLNSASNNIDLGVSKCGI